MCLKGLQTMHKFELLVKRQIEWMENQIARSPPGHARHRPDRVTTFQRLIHDHQELLAFLESLSDKPAQTVETATADKSALTAPLIDLPVIDLPVAAKASSQDLSDLPPELLKELSGGAINGESEPIVEVIDARGGLASLDDILIDMYRKHGELNKRNILANRLYRLSKRGLIWIAPGRKGIYSTHPLTNAAGAGRESNTTLFDRSVAN